MNAWRGLNAYRISIPKKDYENINTSEKICGVDVIGMDDYCEKGVERKHTVDF